MRPSTRRAAVRRAVSLAGLAAVLAPLLVAAPASSASAQTASGPEATISVWAGTAKPGSPSDEELFLGQTLNLQALDESLGDAPGVCVQVSNLSTGTSALVRLDRVAAADYRLEGLAVDPVAAPGTTVCTELGATSSSEAQDVSIVADDGDRLEVTYRDGNDPDAPVDRTQVLTVRAGHDGEIAWSDRNGGEVVVGDVLDFVVHDADVAGAGEVEIALATCVDCEAPETAGPFFLAESAEQPGTFAGPVSLDAADFRAGQTWYGTYQDAAGADGFPAQRVTQPFVVVQAAEAAVAGTVRDLAGAGLADVCVTAFGDDASGARVALQTVRTQSDGTYRVPVPPGRRYIGFSDCANGRSLLTQYWDGKAQLADADPVEVAAEQTVSGIDATMREGAKVSGTVRNAAGDPVGGICVSGQSFDWTPAASYFHARSAADGSYTTLGVEPGEYRVQFYDCSGVTRYPSQFFDRTSDYQAASKVVVGQADVSGIDAALEPYGRVFGTASRQGSTEAGSICVTAYKATTSSSPAPSPSPGPGTSDQYAGGTNTSSTGTYELFLPVGSYRLQFSDCNYNGGTGQTHLSEYYDDAATREAATLVTVVKDGQVELNNAELATAGTISGTAVDGSGDAVSDACVSVARVESASLAWVGGARADDTGAWTVRGLRSGDYKINYSRCSGGLSRWYDDVADVESAKVVPVAAGAAVSGIVLKLPSTGTIRGTVTDVAGDAVAEVCVQASVKNASGGYDNAGHAQTAADGTYSMMAAVGASYVSFHDCSSQRRYLPQYWDGKARLADADPVEVAAKQTVTGIDATMRPGAKVSGTVRNAAGEPVSGICVSGQPYDWTPGSGYFHARSAADGSYTAFAVEPGDYRVHFYDCSGVTRYPSQFFDRTSDYQAASKVVVGQADVSGIDAALEPYGRVFGTASRQGSTEAGNICVTALRAVAASPSPSASSSSSPASSPSPGSGTSDQYAGGANTSSTGAYEMFLPVGSYRLQFSDCASNGGSGPTHFGEFYDDAATREAATLVTVVKDGQVELKNAELAKAGTISGTAVDGSGDAVSDACVSVVRVESASLAWVGGARADDTGAWTVRGLRSGDYKINYHRCSGGSTRWYDDVADVESAKVVPVAAGAAVSGIVLKFPSTGTIRGTVTDVAGDAVAQLCVQASVKNASGGYDYAGHAQTAADGTYSMVAAVGASYVSFHDCSSQRRYLPQYWDGKARLADADPVEVAAKQTVTGIDATMRAGAKVSGTVRNAAGDPVGGICVSGYPFDWKPGAGSFHGRSAADGSYTASAVEPGEYRVEFHDCSGVTRYPMQFFDRTSDYQAASKVVVGQADVSGIDAALEPYGRVFGTASRQGSTEAGNICVTALRAVAASPSPSASSSSSPASSPSPGSGTSDQYAGGANTSSTGAYEMFLPVGSYRLQFYDCNYNGGTGPTHLSEFYDDAATREAATLVTVVKDGQVELNKTELAKAAVLRGKVVNERTGAAMSAVCVNVVHATSGDFAGHGYTGSTGTWSVSLRPGTYKVEFVDCGDNGVAAEWFDGKYSRADATPLSLGTAEVKVVDAALAPLTAVVGSVKNSAGTLLSRICAELWTLDGSAVVADGRTGTDGAYAVPAVPGSYKVRFRDCVKGEYATTWSGGATTFSSASTVVLGSAGDATSDVTMKGSETTAEPAPTASAGTGSVTTDASGEVTVIMPTGRRSDLTITQQVSCPAGQILDAASVQLVLAGRVHAMTAGSGGSYSVTVRAADLASGDLIVRFTCGGDVAVDKIGEIVLYDPSGIVRNGASGEPVVGAAVTLHKVAGWRPRQSSAEDTTPSTCESGVSKAAGAKWSQPAPSGQDAALTEGSGMFSPDVLTQRTNAIGYYGWDVAEGCWYVTVTKTGFKPLVSPVVGVPPEVLDLDLELEPESCSTGPDADADGVNDLCDPVDDVKAGDGFMPSVQTLLRNEVTRGCGATGDVFLYCPERNVTRAEMAVFLLRSLGVKDGTLPAYDGRFGDVQDGFFAPWIQELANRKITLGCGTDPATGKSKYCPDAPVSREQMAAFLLRAKGVDGAALPAYDGRFADVPDSNSFARWIQELATRKVTLGCGADATGKAQYCPASNVTRGQMSAFLVRNFGLT